MANGKVKFSASVLIGTLLLYGFATAVGFDPSLFVKERFYQVRGSRPVPAKLVLVTMDDSDLEDLQISLRTAVPDKVLIKALTRVIQANPSAIIVEPGLLPEEGSNTALSEALQRQALLFFRRQSDHLRPEFAQIYATQLQFTDRSYVDEVIENSYINYYGPPGTVERVSFAQVLQGEQLANLEDRLVFFGLTTTALLRGRRKDDRYSVPTSSDKGMFEIEIQATVVGNLLNGEFIREIPPSISLLVIVCIGMVSIFIATSSLSNLKIFSTLSLLCLLTIIAAYLVFVRGLLWSPLLGLLLLIQLVTILVKVLRELLEMWQKKGTIKEGFSLETPAT